jgi:NAD(P)-dependent dehydrogenase (short-subunit alcohol dehydrogenase family)
VPADTPAAPDGNGSLFERAAPLTEPPRRVLVAGASGGIGAALCDVLGERLPDVELVRLARQPRDLREQPAPCRDLAADLLDEGSLKAAAAALAETPPDWALVATGFLHDRRFTPEKRFQSLDPEHLAHAYRVNAIGPALLVKHLLPVLASDIQPRIGILSARVGSISDNRLGGWYAYRASKAALNMFIRNFSIELARRSRAPIIVGLQPGTTDTALSAPFQRQVPPGQLQSPRYTAEKLIDVMFHLRPEDSGGLFDFLGLPFAP